MALFVRLSAGAGRASGHDKHALPIREWADWGAPCTEKAKAQVVVAVARVVVVAIR